MIPVKIKNGRLNLALIIPAGVPMTVANDAMKILPVITEKTINDFSKQSKEAIYLPKSFAHISLSLISATK